MTHKRESIEREWDESAECWVDFVRQRKDYYRDGLNNPAAFKLIGDIRGQVILDLACGEGYNTRILAMRGAKEVVGVDFSKKLIEFARREEVKEKLGITYFVTDAANLKRFQSNYFDLVTCFMALQDIENHERAVSEVSRVLKNRGRFVFSIPHPCFEAITLKRKRVRATERYFGAVKHTIDWDMERLEKPFRTSSFHRTLTDYFEALHRNKLFISRLVEPKPTREALQKYPSLKDTLTRPQSIVIEAIKIEDVS